MQNVIPVIDEYYRAESRKNLFLGPIFLDNSMIIFTLSLMNSMSSIRRQWWTCLCGLMRGIVRLFEVGLTDIFYKEISNRNSLKNFFFKLGKYKNLEKLCKKSFPDQFAQLLFWGKFLHFDIIHYIFLKSSLTYILCLGIV